MGYSHRFRNAVATAEVIDDANAILSLTSVEVAGPAGTGSPELSLSDGILLNGSAAKNEDYETFHLVGTNGDEYGGSWFCKTARRPYDEVVTAILVSAFLHTGAGVTTDGTWENWQPGIALYEMAVRPLTEDEKIALELQLACMVPEKKEVAA